MCAYYRECSVVAISSVWPEPIATIGLEVMRYGLPIVAFDAGGIKDWLTEGQNGFLIPWMDTVAYAAALDRLLMDKTLARRLGANGLAFVNREYDFLKPQLLVASFKDFLGHGLFLVEGETHKRQRKMMNPAFTHNNIKVSIFFCYCGKNLF